MKISERTRTILKNFNEINPTVKIPEGNTIMASRKGSMLGLANVEEFFPVTFGIADLNTFLGAISLFNEPDLTFYEKYMIISQGPRQVRYTFCDPAIIPTYRLEDLKVNSYVSFSIDEADVKELKKASGILKTPEFRIVSDDGNIYIRACAVAAPSGNEFSVLTGATTETLDFVINSDTLNSMLNMNYKIEVDKRGLISFTGEDVTYFVPAKAKS